MSGSCRPFLIIMEICVDSCIIPRPFHWDCIRCFFRLSIRPQTWGKTSVNPLPVASGLAAMSVRVLSRSSSDHWSVSVPPIDMHRKSAHCLRHPVLIPHQQILPHQVFIPSTLFSFLIERKNCWVMWLEKFRLKLCFFFFFGYLLEIRDVISLCICRPRKSRPSDVRVCVLSPITALDLFDSRSR